MQMSCLYASDLQFEKNCLGKEKWHVLVVGKSVQTTVNHISICFLPQYHRQRKCFFSERELEKVLRDTLTREARSKDFFFASCGSLFPFTRANAQWVIHGFK